MITNIRVLGGTVLVIYNNDKFIEIGPGNAGGGIITEKVGDWTKEEIIEALNIHKNSRDDY